MSLYVVDASVAAKWFFDEEHHEFARRVLSQGNELHVPDFFLLEMDSILSKRIRLGEIEESDGRTIRSAVRRLPLRRHPFVPLMDFGYELAINSRASIYDCLYVALATVLDGEVVTADRRLVRRLSGSPFSDRVRWVEDV